MGSSFLHREYHPLHPVCWATALLLRRARSLAIGGTTLSRISGRLCRVKKRTCAEKDAGGCQFWKKETNVIPVSGSAREGPVW
eukprot:9137353-Pyramimonas_sp.AAC.1